MADSTDITPAPPPRTLRERLVLIAISCPDKPTAHALIDLAGEDDPIGTEPLDEGTWHAVAARFNPWRPGPVPEDATVEVREDDSAWRYCLPPAAGVTP
jgi:hypothetical protein